MTTTAITTTAEAEAAIAQVAALIEELRGVIEQETALVHAGKVRNAVALGPQKSELTSKLHLTGQHLKANAKFLLQTAPTSAAALAKIQEAFRAVLQRNMIVLATAHAVSEGIVRRLSGDLARKAAPQVYGASGRATVPNPKQGKPLAISRVL
jgi:flagellar biosynthesis/type III secretory pathway chaperone